MEVSDIVIRLELMQKAQKHGLECKNLWKRQKVDVKGQKSNVHIPGAHCTEENNVVLLCAREVRYRTRDITTLLNRSPFLNRTPSQKC